MGIDNIVFISIAAGKLPENQVKKATRIGLLLAMVFRILLLLGVSYLISMQRPFYTVELPWFEAGLTGQRVILFFGGIFLLYKSTKEIRHKIEDQEQTNNSTVKKLSATMGMVIFQVVVIDIVFSFDSVLTAVGMTNGIDGGPGHNGYRCNYFYNNHDGICESHW